VQWQCAEACSDFSLAGFYLALLQQFQPGRVLFGFVAAIPAWQGSIWLWLWPSLSVSELLSACIQQTPSL